MIIKKKKKRDPQRLKHAVRFDIEFFLNPKENAVTKLLIVFVQPGSISDKKFFIGDTIKSINGVKVEIRTELDNEINKVNWGDEVFFDVERNNKIKKVKIKTISFDHYKKNRAVWSLEVKKENKSIIIKNHGIEYNYDNELDDGDTLSAINSEKITSIDDFNREKSKYKVGDKVDLTIHRKNQPHPKIVTIKLISFEKAIKLNKKSCENHYLKKVGSLLFKEWVETDYGQNHKDWYKRREEILKLEFIAERFAESRFTKNSDEIRKWKNKDARLISKLIKPEYKDINFKLNFFSLIFNPKVIEKLKSISLKNECCYSFILAGKTIGGDWDKKVAENIENFQKLISVKDKKKELFIDKISETTKNFFFNLIIDKKKNLNIKYQSKKKNKLEEKRAELSSSLCLGFESITDLLTDWFEKKYKFNKAKIKLAVDDWCKSFFLEYPEFTHERIEEIKSMALQDDPVEDENEYQDNEKIYISTNIKKKKINGKDSFVVKLNNLPDNNMIEKLEASVKDIGDGPVNKIYLKIYVYDVTDLDSDKYYEIQDTTGETSQYFSNNCHVIKTEDFSWSEGNNILVQSKRLETWEENPDEIAFPYSKMQLPKYGKRKLSFRSFICTGDQKFDENNGRFIWNDEASFRAEEFYLDTYEDYRFDEYGDYPEILSYSSSEIEVEYKQPGYLELNRIKYNDLKIALSFALTQNEEENLKGNFEKIKEDIRYGDFSTEGNIYKILNLKKNYEKALNNRIKLDNVLKDLKKNSVIHERYEIIDFLLNLATKDETFSKKENNFIDKISKELELNKEKYQEIKKQKTASVKFVDFGDKTGESVFGITKEMNAEEKLKTLRKEYSRWNALTNNSDKTIRERAREMRDLAANLRSQYTK